jgi:ribosome maturation factor RimP
MDETLLLESVLKSLLGPALNTRGFDLIRARITAGGRYHTLHIMAERSDGKPITVQDCVAISHIATVRLETQGLPPDSYTLEVTAPGQDRPLVRIEDFERFAGQMAVVDLQSPVEGRQRFSGRIVRVTNREANAEIELKTATGPVRVPMKRIAEARLSAAPETPSTEGDTETP